MKNLTKIIIGVIAVIALGYTGTYFFFDGVKVVGVILERQSGTETIQPELWQYEAQRPLIKQKGSPNAADNLYRFKSNVPLGNNRFLAKLGDYSALTVVRVLTENQKVKIEMPSGNDTDKVTGLDLIVVVTDKLGAPVDGAEVVIDRRGGKDAVEVKTGADGKTDAIEGYLTAGASDLIYDYYINVESGGMKGYSEFTTYEMTKLGIATVYITVE
jgi:flagellar basal body-associated protein FliL